MIYIRSFLESGFWVRKQAPLSSSYMLGAKFVFGVPGCGAGGFEMKHGKSMLATAYTAYK